MSGTTSPSRKGAWSGRAGRRKLAFPAFLAILAGFIVYAVAISLRAGGATAGLSSLAQTSGIQVGGPLVGEAAPEFSLSSVTSPLHSVALRQFIGRPIVLNFFASWCVACKTELPEFATLSKSYAGRVRFLGVDENDTRAAAVSLLVQGGVNYPSAFDGQGQLEQPYHLIGLPTTFFIDSKGTVVEVVAGQITPSMLASDLAKIANH
ncbi:MAG: TlpA disulfide reductase family protein [Actinomycetota bacterium]|nr:TlpA disulfide reductase family protein [Actinomycetota bacterium]